MVFDLCRYRSNCLDSAVESIAWLNIINRTHIMHYSIFIMR